VSVAFVAHTAASGNVGNAQNPTLSLTVSGTNPVIVTDCALDSTTATCTGCSWSLGSGASSEIVNARSSTAYGAIRAIPAPTGGAGTVTINKSAAGVNHQLDASCFSGADQTTPCPVADAQSNTVAATTRTLTPTNLVSGDASHGMAVNTVADNPNSVTTNQRYLDSSTSVNAEIGDSANTTGVTFGHDFGTGNHAYVAVRIQQPAAPATPASRPMFRGH